MITLIVDVQVRNRLPTIGTILQTIGNERQNHLTHKETTSSNPFDKNICFQLCDHVVHSYKVCRSQSLYHLQARANIAGHFPHQQTPCIVNSGATHHIASDAQSLDNVHDYGRTEEITMGNWSHHYDIPYQ